jgi:hypothetical protein
MLKKYALTYCDYIGDYVLTFDNGYFSRSLEVTSEITKNISIITTLSTEQLGKNYELVIDSLGKKYDSFINDEEYSLVHFKWKFFSGNDIALIKEAIEF